MSIASKNTACDKKGRQFISGKQTKPSDTLACLDGIFFSYLSSKKKEKVSLKFCQRCIAMSGSLQQTSTDVGRKLHKTEYYNSDLCPDEQQGHSCERNKDEDKRFDARSRKMSVLSCQDINTDVANDNGSCTVKLESPVGKQRDHSEMPLADEIEFESGAYITQNKSRIITRDTDQDNVEKQEFNSPDICQRLEIREFESYGCNEDRQPTVDQKDLQKHRRKKSISEKGNKKALSTKTPSIRRRRKSTTDNFDTNTQTPKPLHTDKRRRSMACYEELDANIPKPPNTRQRRKSVACSGELDGDIHVPKPPGTHQRKMSVDQSDSNKLSRLRHKRNSLHGLGQLDTKPHQASSSRQRKVSIVDQRQPDNQTPHLPRTHQRRQSSLQCEEINPEMEGNGKTFSERNMTMPDSAGDNIKFTESDVELPVSPSLNNKESGVSNNTEKNIKEHCGPNSAIAIDEKNQPFLKSALRIPSENSNCIQSFASTCQERFTTESEKDQSKAHTCLSPQSDIVLISDQLREKLKTTDDSNINCLPLGTPLRSPLTLGACHISREATTSSPMSPSFLRKTNEPQDLEKMTSVQLSPALRQRKKYNGDNCGQRSPFSPVLLTRGLIATNEAISTKSNLPPKLRRRMQRGDLGVVRRMGSPVSFGETSHFPRIDEQNSNDKSGFENEREKEDYAYSDGRWQYLNDSLEGPSPLSSPVIRVRRLSSSLTSQAQDHSIEGPYESQAKHQRKKSIDEMSMLSLCTDTYQKQQRKRSLTQREVREKLAKSVRRTSLPAIRQIDPFIYLQGRDIGIKQPEEATMHPRRERRGSLPPTDLLLPENPLGVSSRRERRGSLPPTHLHSVEDKIASDLMRDRGPYSSNEYQSTENLADQKSMLQKDTREKSRRRISLPSIGQTDPFLVLQQRIMSEQMNIQTAQESSDSLPYPHSQFKDQLGTTNPNIERRESIDPTKLQSKENRSGCYFTSTEAKMGNQSFQEGRDPASAIGTASFENQMIRKQRGSLSPAHLESLGDLRGGVDLKQESKHNFISQRWNEMEYVPPVHLQPVRNIEEDSQGRKRRVSLPAASLRPTEGLEHFVGHREESIGSYSIRKRRRSLSDSNNTVLARNRQTYQHPLAFGLDSALSQSFCHLIPREFVGIPSCERREENVHYFRTNLCLQRRDVKSYSDTTKAHNLQQALDAAGNEGYIRDDNDDLERPATPQSPVVSDIEDEDIEPTIHREPSISDETVLPPRTPEPEILEEFSTNSDTSSAQGKNSYEPRYCWCTRCQMMYQMYKDNDNRLEAWGKYPCFKF